MNLSKKADAQDIPDAADAADAVDVVLITPPVWLSTDFELDFPPLGNPMLAGTLRASGFKVRHFDLNADFFRFLVGHILVDTLVPGPFDSLDRLARSSLSLLLDDWLEEWNRQARPRDLIPIRKLSFRELVEAQLSRLYRFIESDSPMRQYLEQSEAAAELLKARARVFGISILSPDQAFAAIACASHIRKRRRDACIVLGGPWATLFAERLAQIGGVRDLFDAIVLGEGEEAIVGLARLSHLRNAWTDIPNLLFLSGGKTVVTPFRQVDMNTMCAPDFSDLDLEQYTFRHTITYQTSRGCYWGKCVFCEHIHGCHLKQYRERSMQIVLDDLERFFRGGVERVIFSDAALRPDRLWELSEGILKRGIRLEWWAFARPEKTFTGEHFALAKRAGCKWLNFGLETVNPRVAAKMRRGKALDYSGRVFALCAEQGIKVLVGAIVRLPTESEQEAAETLDFLLRNRKHITRPSVNLFNLQRNTYVEKSPQEFDLKVLESEEELLRSHLRAESGQSLSLQRANELIRSFKLAWADGPKKRSAPENIMDAQWTGKNLSVFRIRLDNLSGVSGKGLCIAVHSVNGELSVCRVNEGDVALIQHLKDPVSGREFAACLASTFKIGLRDAETLAEHQIGQYYLQGLIAADKKGDIHEHSVEARSRI